MIVWIHWVIGMSLALPLFFLLLFKIYMSSGAMCSIRTRLEGKVVIITGGNSGIGRALAMLVALRGARVILACRNKVKGEAMVTYIRKRCQTETVHYMPLDLECVKSTREFVHIFMKQFGSIYALVNNAAYLGPKGTTRDGHDLCFQTNFLGHFMLTQLLIAAVKPDKARPMRVINVTSDSYKSNFIDLEDLMTIKTQYDMYQAYGRTKLAMVWYSNEINYRYAGTGITSVCVLPGAVHTSLLRHWPGVWGLMLRAMAKMFFQSPDIGAQSALQALVVDYMEDYIGRLIQDCKGTEIAPVGKEYRLAERMFGICMDTCGLEDTMVVAGKKKDATKEHVARQ